MCLLTYFPPNAIVDRAALERGARSNPHGHGFAIVTTRRTIVRHAMSPTALLDEFVKLRRQYPKSHALFHSRITTHGGTKLENCHPFEVSGPSEGTTILAHNGILPADCHPAKGDDRSDTRILADGVLWERWANLDDEDVRADMEKWLGRGSKVLVLTRSRKFKARAYLLNEKLGDWVDGVWYSNTSHQAWKPSKSLASYGWADDGFWTSYTGSGTERKTWWEDAESPTVAKPVVGGFWSSEKFPRNIGAVTYRTHFPHRKCAGCRAQGFIAKYDYLCEWCGMCFICDRLVEDCDDVCGYDPELRVEFDKVVGFIPPASWGFEPLPEDVVADLVEEASKAVEVWADRNATD